MRFEELSNGYQKIDDYLFSSEVQLTDKINEILLRGYVCCNNDDIKRGVTMMLTGINPSFMDKDEVYKHAVCGFPVSSISSSNLRHWKEKQKQFGEILPLMAYFDLFPIRESHQDHGFEKTFLHENDIRRQFLEITQRAIEDLAPKLIVHANRDSMYYWGIKKYGKGKDLVNPWMGYAVEKITRSNTPSLPDCCTEERLNRFPLYKILGFMPSEKRINQEQLQNSNLKYIMEYVMSYRNKEYIKYLYTSKEWKEIFEWLNK